MAEEVQSEFGIGDYIEIEVEGKIQNGVVMGIKNKDGRTKVDIGKRERKRKREKERKREREKERERGWGLRGV